MMLYHRRRRLYAVDTFAQEWLVSTLITGELTSQSQSKSVTSGSRLRKESSRLNSLLLLRSCIAGPVPSPLRRDILSCIAKVLAASKMYEEHTASPYSLCMIEHDMFYVCD